MLPSNNRRGGTKGDAEFRPQAVGSGSGAFLYSPVMDYTLRFRQCDQGCCFWIDGRPVGEAEFLDARASPTSSFLEEGKRGGLTPANDR